MGHGGSWFRDYSLHASDARQPAFWRWRSYPGTLSHSRWLHWFAILRLHCDIGPEPG